MNTLARQVVSLVVGLAGIVLLGIGINTVLDIGSCSSGGPYVSVRPCPEGTGTVFWLMILGVFGWVAGMLLSPRQFFAPGAGQVLWTVAFAGGGVALLVKVLTQPMPPDAKLGASIMAAVFVPMGLGVGIVGVVQLIRRRPGKPSKKEPVSTVPVDDAWSRMKALNDLRSTGALTRAEFTALRDAPGDSAAGRVALIRELQQRRERGALSTSEFESGKRRVLSGETVE
ncbi:SHOCT domain-containing protein [Dactylosporangium sp. CS-047395]|uniref:SHOCT domain-containing protein n=1 Tax=Dactylosporangium sp. CS-047395 TaxID=3239936 RepID=UPI003D9384E2